jgi:phosphatidyl-myo-inositol alpha-mannosyltransferase
VGNATPGGGRAITLGAEPAMKIALVSPYDLSVPGGVNSHILPLAHQFRQAGHETRIIGPASDPASLPDPDGMIVIGRPFPVPASGSIARIALSLRLAGQVKKVLRNEQFDVVHVHEPLMPLLPIQFLRFSDAVNVGTFHAAREGKHRLYSYTRRLLRRWYRKLDGKIAVSPPAAALVSRYFPGYYNIIPNGVDIEQFSRPCDPIEQFVDGKRNILFLGRFEKRKGLSYLLRAFRAVKREMPNTRLIIGGDGRSRPRYERYVREAGLEDVIFTGYIQPQDLARYQRTADIYCSPATGNESAGIVLLEAMAAGRAIVASNIEGYASVVTHGVEGLLVMPKNPEALSHAIVHLLADDAMRQHMGEMGQLRAESFSWQRVSQRVLSYYERLLYEKCPKREA